MKWQPVVAIAVGLAVAVVLVVARAPDRDRAEVIAGRDWDASRLTVSDRIGVENPIAIAVTDEAVWIAQSGSPAVSRVNPASGKVDQRVTLPYEPRAIAATASAVWVSGARREDVTRIDPTTGFTSVVSLPRASLGPLAVADDGIWIATSDGHATRLDQRGAVTAELDLGVDAASMAHTSGTLWVLAAAGKLLAFDTDATTSRASLALGDGDYRLAVGGGAVWVSDTRGDRVRQLSLDGSETLARVRVGRGAKGIAVGAGGVWVIADGRLIVIDPGASEVVASVPVGGDLTDLAVRSHDVWVVDREGDTVIRVPLR